MPYHLDLVDALSVVVEAYSWEELTTLLFFAGTPLNLRCALAARLEELAPDVLQDYETVHTLRMKVSRLLLHALEAAGTGCPNALFTPEEAIPFRPYASTLRLTLGDVEDALLQTAVDDLFEPSSPFSDKAARRVWYRLCTV